MGNAIRSVRKCLCVPSAPKAQKTNLTVLVIGDDNIGKRKLINDYYAHHLARDIEPSIRDNQDPTRTIQMKRMFTHNTVSHNVAITLTDFKSSEDHISRHTREAQYKHADIIFLMYDIGNATTAVNMDLNWQKEFNNCFQKGLNKKVQLVTVGIDPKARDEAADHEIVNEDELDKLLNDMKNVTLADRRKKSPRNDDDSSVNRRSISRAGSQKILKKLSIKGSRADRVDREVNRGDVDKLQKLFNDVIDDYVKTNMY